MIEIQPIADTHTLVCPHCSAPLLGVTSSETHVIGGGYWLTDGDTVDVETPPFTPAQCSDPRAWATELLIGSRPCCDVSYIVVTVTFIDAQEPPYDFQNRFFYQNETRGPQTNYTANRGDQNWIVKRFASPLGPVLEHLFGPFAWGGTSWVSEHGVARCQEEEEKGSPWTFARKLLAEAWDDLRAMNARPEMQIEPTDAAWLEHLSTEKPLVMAWERPADVDLDAEIPF